MKIIAEKEEKVNPITESFKEFFERFKLSRILRRCGAHKKSGVIVNLVMLFLLGIVFTGKKASKLNRHYEEEMPFGKDVAYRFIERKDVRWERLVFYASNEVIPEVKRQTKEKRQSALVIDDTTQYRDRSKKVEMLALCHDHATQKYYKGHTLLTMGWTDGQTFVPVDYRVLSASEDKNLIYGSEVSEDNRTIATKRRKDARAGKPKLVLDMLRNVKGSASDAEYVMFDSWFSSPSAVVPICEMGYKVVTMLKDNKTKYLYDGELRSLKEIYARNRKRRGRSKYLLSVDVEVILKDHENVKATIVFARNKNKRSEWVALLSTDLSLSEEEVIALYGKRWDIEVFFKVCKSTLRLGKEFQCRSFDSTCALVAVVFLRYMKLALDNRESRDPCSIGDLFFSCCKELEDSAFARSLALLFDALDNLLHDHLCLSSSAIDIAVRFFLAALPPKFKTFLPLHFCET